MNADTHERSVLVWDVPAAIERGEPFRVTVGLKCRSGCKPDGWTIEIRDPEGSLIASARAGNEPWPGTALYHAELRLAAPEAEGLYTWEALAPAEAPDDQQDGAHDETRASFDVRVVPAPECRLTVVAIDRESGTPVKGAKVVIHPYRALTDERGVAEVRVPKGAYRLFVSGRDYFPYRNDGEAVEDATIRAELESDSGPSDAELWS